MLNGHRENALGSRAMPAGRIVASEIGTVLAFDFGTKRIGVAVGETELRMAHPLAVIESERNVARFEAVAALISEWRPQLLIVGLPFAVDGSEHEMTARCRRFANQLMARYGIPVRLVDERFSSTAAESLLRDAGARGRGDKGRIDTASAQVILQSYFDRSDLGT
jgi:putative Holliday junction resolvase